VKCRSQKLDHITYSNVFIFHSCVLVHEQCYSKMVYVSCVHPVFIETKYTFSLLLDFACYEIYSFRYSGGSVATGKVSQAGQVKSEVTD
jgi:hypothetical protein